MNQSATISAQPCNHSEMRIKWNQIRRRYEAICWHCSADDRFPLVELQKNGINLNDPVQVRNWIEGHFGTSLYFNNK